MMKGSRRRRARPVDLLEDALTRLPPEAAGPARQEGDAEIAELAALAGELRRLAPRPAGAAARHRVWARIQRGIREAQPSGAWAPRSGAPARPWVRRPAFALIVLLTAFGLVGASAGAAFASEDALPGDLLYPLKRGIESARIALSQTSEGDAALLLEFADERLREAEALADVGNGAALAEALRGYDEALDRVVDLVDLLPEENGEGSIAGVEDHLSRHIAVLERVQAQVPPSAADVIGEVIERVGEHQEEAERARGGGQGHDDTPPGQVGRTPGPPQDQDHGPDREDRPGKRNNGRSSGNDAPGGGPPRMPGPP